MVSDLPKNGSILIVSHPLDVKKLKRLFVYIFYYTKENNVILCKNKTNISHQNFSICCIFTIFYPHYFSVFSIIMSLHVHKIIYSLFIYSLSQKKVRHEILTNSKATFGNMRHTLQLDTFHFGLFMFLDKSMFSTHGICVLIKWSRKRHSQRYFVSRHIYMFDDQNTYQNYTGFCKFPREHFLLLAVLQFVSCVLFRVSCVHQLLSVLWPALCCHFQPH